MSKEEKKYTKIDWSFKEQQIMYLVTRLCRFAAGVVEVTSINLLANCFVWNFVLQIHTQMSPSSTLLGTLCLWLKAALNLVDFCLFLANFKINNVLCREIWYQISHWHSLEICTHHATDGNQEINTLCMHLSKTYKLFYFYSVT